MVATHTSDHPFGAQINIYGFRVVGVPDAEHPEYSVRIGTTQNGRMEDLRPFGTLHFRAGDGAITEYDAGDEQPRIEKRPALPFLGEFGPIFQALAYPSLPPRREAIFDFPPPVDPSSSVWQVITPIPEGLRFTIWQESEFGLQWIDMDWRRGEPWWSTLRVWGISFMEERLPEGGPLAPILSASADLLHEEEMIDATSSRGGFKVKAPKQWPPRPQVNEWPTRTEPAPIPR